MCNYIQRPVLVINWQIWRIFCHSDASDGKFLLQACFRRDISWSRRNAMKTLCSLRKQIEIIGSNGVCVCAWERAACLCANWTTTINADWLLHVSMSDALHFYTHWYWWIRYEHRYTLQCLRFSTSPSTIGTINIRLPVTSVMSYQFNNWINHQAMINWPTHMYRAARTDKEKEREERASGGAEK